MRGFGSWKRSRDPVAFKVGYAVSITRKDCGKARQRRTSETPAGGMPGFLSLAARVRGTPLTPLKISGYRPLINLLDWNGWVLQSSGEPRHPNVPPNYLRTKPPSIGITAPVT